MVLLYFLPCIVLFSQDKNQAIWPVIINKTQAKEETKSEIKYFLKQWTRRTSMPTACTLKMLSRSSVKTLVPSLYFCFSCGILKATTYSQCFHRSEENVYYWNKEACRHQLQKNTRYMSEGEKTNALFRTDTKTDTNKFFIVYHPWFLSLLKHLPGNLTIIMKWSHFDLL